MFLLLNRASGAPAAFLAAGYEKRAQDASSDCGGDSGVEILNENLGSLSIGEIGAEFHALDKIPSQS